MIIRNYSEPMFCIAKILFAVRYFPICVIMKVVNGMKFIVPGTNVNLMILWMRFVWQLQPG